MLLICWFVTLGTVVMHILPRLLPMHVTHIALQGTSDSYCIQTHSVIGIDRFEQCENLFLYLLE